MKKAVLYFRVSTADQTTENQVPDLRRYAEFREWEIAAEYRDEAMSGAKETRPQLEKMMSEIRAGKYNVLLVWSYDRFARSLIHLVTTLDQLRALGVDFVSFREQLDTTSPEGRMMFGFYAVMAEFERGRIAARTKATLARLKAQGKKLGRPPINNPEVISTAHRLRQEGHSLRFIATWTNRSKTWVANVLKTPPDLMPDITV
jgi:DNA invertase Pin-like site-specific DNA recombinase